MAEEGTPIANATANAASASSYNVCQRTGFRVKPGKLVQEWTGLWVLPEVCDRRSMQDFVRTEAESLTGPEKPEQSDYFIDSISDGDDL